MADNKLNITTDVEIKPKEGGDKKLKSTLDKILKKVKEIEKAFGKQTTAITSAIDKQTKALKRKKKALDAVENTEKRNSSSRVKRVVQTISLYASVGTAIYGVVNYIKKLGMEMLELERNLARVSAITGSTSSAIKSLQATVVGTASSFNVGTDELGKFVITASKLGLGIDQIRTLSTESVTLSKILGEDMSEAAILITTTARAFNITMEESSRITSVFYNIIKKTPAGINDLKTAMQYIAPAAEATGVSIENAGAMMELLFNRGLKASKIGTGIRNMFAEISSSGDGVIETLRVLSEEGFSFSDAVDMFGKRGALAATLLIQNFGELEELMAQELPSSIDTLMASIKATENTLDWWGRLWESIKLPFVNEEALDEYKKNNALRSLTQYVKEEQIPELIKAYESGLSVSEIADKFDILKTVIRGGTGGGHYESESEAMVGLKILLGKVDEDKRKAEEIESYKKEALNNVAMKLLGRSAVTTGKDKDTFNSILSEYIYDEGSGNEAIRKIEELRKDEGLLIDRYGKESPLGKKHELIKSEMASALSVAESIASVSDTVFDSVKDYRKYYDSNGVIISLASENTEDIIKHAEDAEKKQAVIKKLCQAGNAYVIGLGLCEQFKKGARDKNTAMDLSGLSNGKAGDFVPELSAGEWQNQLRAGIESLANDGDLTEISTTISDYYRLVSDKIIDAESEALILIDAERERLKHDYGAVVIDLEELISSTSSESTKSDYKNQLIKAAEEYGRELESLESQEVKVTEDSKKKQALAYKKFIDSIIALQKEKEKIDKENNKDTEKNLRTYLDIVNKAVNALADIYNKFAQENLNNRLDAIAAEIEAVQYRADVENDILKSQFDNNIITAEAYAKKRTELEKKRIAEENALNKAAFEAQKKADINAAIVNGAAQSAQAFIQGFISGGGYPYGLVLGLAGAAIVQAKSAAEVSAINKRKFTPVKYADGGEVIGASHANGGVPFTVNGQGGYEMEGGEYIVNKDSTEKYKPLLDAINKRPKRYNDNKFFADGGMVNGSSGTNKSGQEQYIRAYITKRDLRDYEDGERKIKQISSL